jgi:hypothetical protein
MTSWDGWLANTKSLLVLTPPKQGIKHREHHSDMHVDAYDEITMEPVSVLKQ